MKDYLTGCKRWLKRLLSRKVLAGPFKGMGYVPGTHPGGALLPKLLGTYELELHDIIATVCQPGKYDHFLDCGAAEGWYAVGIAKLQPRISVIAYEMDEPVRRLLNQMVARNGVHSRVQVCGKIEPAELDRRLRTLPGHTFMLMDVEGGEGSLLDPRAVPALKSAEVLAELHPMYVPDIEALVKSRFASSHTLQFIPARQRTASDALFLLHWLFKIFPRLGQRVLWERPPGMCWVWLKPKEPARLRHLAAPPAKPADPLLVLGTGYHAGSSEVLERQQRSRQALLNLTKVHLVNLQFPDSPRCFPGFENLPVLRTDSVKITGRKSVRKPMTAEAFAHLAQTAGRVGARYFGWVNADIQVSQEVVLALERDPRETFLFSRTDVDQTTGQRRDIFWVGIDLFIYRVDWWRQNQWRFRNYILGEALFDPVFTAISLCHSNGILFNNRDLILHPHHDRVWLKSPFSDWNIRLACQDFLYLEKWNRYAQHLAFHSPAGASDEAMEKLQRQFFHWPPPMGARIWQQGRTLKAHGRYYLNKAGLIPSVYYPV